MSLAILDPPATAAIDVCGDCGEVDLCIDGCECEDCMEACLGCGYMFLAHELKTRKVLVTIGPDDRVEDVRMCSCCIDAGVFDNYSDESD